VTNNPNILRRIAADSSLALVLKVFAVPLGYITNLAIARLYGAEAMGTYYIALNLVVAVTPFCCLGLHTGLLRFVAGFKVDGNFGALKNVFYPAIGLVTLLSGVAGLIIYVSGTWLSGRFHAPDLPALLHVMALALPITVVMLLVVETVRALGGVRWVILQQNVLTPISFLLLLTLVAWGGHGYLIQSSLALAYLLSALLGLIFLIIWPGINLGFKGSLSGGSSLKDLFRYSWPLFLSSILFLAVNGLDSLILGLFTRPQEVAYYTIATRTAPLVTFPLLAINAVVPPLFAQFHHRGDFRGLEMVARSTARWMYFVALPLAIMTILLAPTLLGFFGPDFAQARFALSILAVGQLVNVSAGSVAFILQMTGNQWGLIMVQIITAIGVVPLMALGAAFMGLNGVAVAGALGIAGLNVLMAWAVWRRLQIKAFAQKIGPANLGGLLGVALFYLTSPYLGPFGGAVFFAAGYLALAAKPIQQELSSLLENPRLTESVS
jgi:O-antigen/teichoic acid export membrane protein